MSAIMEELRYRWQHGQPSLLGELRPALMEMTNGLGPLTARVVFAIGPPDRVSVVWKRRLRAFLGYGSGWTLWGAIREKAICMGFWLLWLVPCSLIALMVWRAFEGER